MRPPRRAGSGLLGSLAPGGGYRIRELDTRRASQGPLRRNYHPLLAVERANCPQPDGPHARIEWGLDGASEAFVGEEDADGEMKCLDGQQRSGSMRWSSSPAR